MTAAINYEAWARNAVAFIRERGLEDDFKHWSGGWPCPIEAKASVIAAAPDLLEALKGAVAAWERLYPSFPLNSAIEDAEFAEFLTARAALTKAQGQEVAPDGRGSSVSGDEG